MANTFSAMKRVRQTERRTQTNRRNTSQLRTALRRLRAALTGGDAKGAQQVYRETVSMIDRSLRKGVIHRNTAARYKSRLAARLKAK